MKRKLEKIKVLETYIKHHGGSFGEGIETQIAMIYTLKWVLGELSKEDEEEFEDVITD